MAKSGMTQEDPPTVSTSSKPSMFNSILLSLAFIGLGACAGYTSFYLLYTGRCTALLNELASASEKEWREKYSKAVEEKDQCLTEGKEEIYTLQGRLEAHVTLADRHQALLIKEEEHKNSINAMTDKLRAHEAILEQTKANEAQILGELRKELKTAKAKQLVLEKSLQAKEKRLAAQTEATDRAVAELQQCNDAKDPGLGRIQDYLQKRSARLCRMEFGQGPFYIEIQLQFPAEATSPGEDTRGIVELELVPLMDLPHSIYTFLTLVDLQLYDGTNLILADSENIQGGSPLSANRQQVAKLLERYDKFGLDPQGSLALNEYTSSYPNAAFSFGFVDDGPDLNINLVDHPESKVPCFGKVIRGFDALTRIQNAPKLQDNPRLLSKPIQIISMRLNRSPSMEEEEELSNASSDMSSESEPEQAEDAKPDLESVLEDGHPNADGNRHQSAQAVDSHEDESEQDNVGETIRSAAIDGDLDLVEKLLRLRPQHAFEADQNGWQPIHEATRAGHTQIVRFLVDENKVDVNTRTGIQGGTALWWAYNFGMDDAHPTVGFLKARGAISVGPGEPFPPTVERET